MRFRPRYLDKGDRDGFLRLLAARSSHLLCIKELVGEIPRVTASGTFDRVTGHRLLEDKSWNGKGELG